MQLMRSKAESSVRIGFLLILILLALLTACSPQDNFQKQLDSAMAESFTYSTYESNGFSIEYPYWKQADKASDVEVSVSRGYCSVVVNKEKLPAETKTSKAFIVLCSKPPQPPPSQSSYA